MRHQGIRGCFRVASFPWELQPRWVEREDGICSCTTEDIEEFSDQSLGLFPSLALNISKASHLTT